MENFNPDIDILYEEGPCLAINKPGGLLTQAPPGIDSLEHRVKSYLMRSEGKTENDYRRGGPYLGIPHRLDRPVSGVILFAKNSRATHRLSEQFEARQIDKTYWAIVEGEVESDQETWTDYMRKIPDCPKAEIVSPINPNAREAILHYTVLDRFPLEIAGVRKMFSRLEVKLETGRMHQIRLQSSTHGHPILGDATYGSTFPFGAYFDEERKREIALHARSISFQDPTLRTPVQLEAPLPPVWDFLMTAIDIGT